MVVVVVSTPLRKRAAVVVVGVEHGPELFRCCHPEKASGTWICCPCSRGNKAEGTWGGIQQRSVDCFGGMVPSMHPVEKKIRREHRRASGWRGDVTGRSFDSIPGFSSKKQPVISDVPLLAQCDATVGQGGHGREHENLKHENSKRRSGSPDRGKERGREGGDKKAGKPPAAAAAAAVAVQIPMHSPPNGSNDHAIRYTEGRAEEARKEGCTYRYPS